MRTRITATVVEPRTCEVCHGQYTPRWQEQRTCGGKARCSRVLGGQSHKGQIPPQFAAKVQQRKAAKRRAFDAAFDGEFGALSVREYQIVCAIERYAYDLGYSAGLKHQRRQKPEEAA